MIRNILLHYGVYSKHFLDRWNIRIYPLDKTDPRFYEHLKTTDGVKINSHIPSGVTGLRVMTLFVHDSMNNRKMMENARVIGHELAHAILLDRYGTKDKQWVKGVHGNDWIFNFKFWYSKWWVLWRYIPITLVDIRYLLQ